MADCLEETTSTHLDNDRIIDNLNFQKYEMEIHKHDFREFGIEMPKRDCPEEYYNADDVKALMDGVRQERMFPEISRQPAERMNINSGSSAQESSTIVVESLKRIQIRDIEDI